MEILNSGSFIPLDNRVRIEQLIFTACTLAYEVSRNEEFRSSGQTNQQIGLELWKGAEYMTRSHEEVTIRNIFLSKFLEKLREIERESTQRPSIANAPPLRSEEKFSASDTSDEPATQNNVKSSELPAQRDEFLGVVDSEDPGKERPSYASECIPECEDEITSILSSAGTSRVVDVIGEQGVERIPLASVEERMEVGDSVSQSPPEVKSNAVETDVDRVAKFAEIETSVESPHVSGDAAGSLTEEQPVESVVLTEEEPYDFHSCTVTAVLQLLPEADGMRRCVLSVRSHTFAPLIIFSSIITDEDSRPDFSAQLSDALEQYRAALPGLAAEKLKKEKPSTKKRTSRQGDKTPTVGETTTTTNTETTPSPSPSVQVAAKDQQDLFAS